MEAKRDMTGNQMFILADDLTGANDTAIQFVKQGLSALVITHAEFSGISKFAAYDILSINSDSRGMSPKDAYNELRKIMTQLKAAKLEGAYYKKVDSVLRGNPGPELAAVMDELGIPLAIAAPSFPANRSIVEQGMLKSGKTSPQAVTDAVKIFAGSMDKKVESMPLDIIRGGHLKAAEFLLARHKDGVQVFVADAVNDEDLAIIRRLSAAIEKPHILAGSAGLGNQIAQSMGRNPAAAPLSLGSQTPALIIAGTRQGETAAQIVTLSEKFSAPIVRFRVDLAEEGRSEEAIKLAFEEAAEAMKKNPALCIVAVASMFKSEIPEGNVAWNKADSDAGGDAISAALGILAGNLIDAFRFPALLSTGGDTSLEICKRLGVAGIQPIAEICPGIPIGKIIGGSCENRYIITKSGRFGTGESLVEIMRYLGNA